jgi:acetone carboxylase gamma subunit
VCINIIRGAQLDPEILKVVAFHEFAHYFLEYSTHICNDCGQVMSVVNSSYFDIIRDWDRQIEMLFEESPAFLKQLSGSVTTRPMN